ncbi:MAG: pre-peptidase C-terminal domain-containing protein, partial [Planctomycetes bacterium]|nr:pre-peptidase C-terminal domain-containing protein [Planctomycetota bacterium]
ESGAITAPMQVFSDSPTASAGQHIGTVDGIGDENDNPPADGVATYSFDVPADGVYRLAIRVIITGGSNSFWLRIPGMATNTTNHASGWVRMNGIPDSDAWHWNEVFSEDDDNSVVEFTLSAGTHTLEIARREDGTLLDAIAVIQ